MNEDYEGLVCVGCANLAENGENIGDSGDGIQPVDGPDGYHLVIGDVWGFAKSRCDSCGSQLGGDRFEATFIRTV